MGSLWGESGPKFTVLGADLGLSWRSWALWASVGGPGLTLGPLWAVLGCSRAFRGQSWADPGPSVGDPGLTLGPLWAILGCPWALSGPNPSGSVIRKGSGPLRSHKSHKPPTHFYL